MRRTQSVRSRPSHHPAPSDDLAVVRESAEQTIEDALRHDLAALQRENDKLQSQVESLNAALRQRPPIERVQELEKEFHSLELLLRGTQRENERAMAELERAKSREKLLERELRKFAGDDWQETLNLSGNLASLPSVRASGSNLTRLLATDVASSSVPPSPTRPTAEQAQPPPAAPSLEKTLVHMEQIRAMLLGMNERLQSGELKIQQAIDRATEEMQKLEESST